MGRWVRSLVLVMLVLPLASPLAGKAQDGQLGKLETETVDLGAMMLTPYDLEDLGLEGYFLREGWTDTLDEELISILDASSDLSADELQELMEGSEFQYSRVVQHDLASEEDPAYAGRRVTSWINLHGGDDGLEELLDGLFQIGGGAEPSVEGTETIGDYSRIDLFQDTDPDTGNTILVMMLGFAYENFTAFVQISEYLDALPDIEPTVEEAEAIAGRMLEKIEAGMGKAEPGMDMMPVRMESDGLVGLITGDFYVRLDGETMPVYGEDEAAVERRGDEYDEWNIDNAYAFDETFGLQGTDDQWLRWSVRLRQHGGEDDAEAWQAEEPERSLARFDVEDLEFEEVDGFGDNAVLATYTQPNQGWALTAVFFQSGEFTVGVYLVTKADSFDGDVLLELAEEQLACIEAGGCTGEIEIPDEILEYVGA
jgi:hypothetical protein